MPTHIGQSGFARYGAVVALCLLGAITAIVSYAHAYTVVHDVGNTRLLAILIPFVPDLTIVTSYLVLLDAAQSGARKPPLAIAALWGGIAVTVVMNAAAGWSHGRPGALVAAMAPLALIVALHILISRGHRTHLAVAAGPRETTTAACPHGPAATAEDVVRLVHDHASGCHGERLSQRQLAEITVPSRPRVAELVRQSVNGHHVTGPEERDTTTDVRP